MSRATFLLGDAADEYEMDDNSCADLVKGDSEEDVRILDKDIRHLENGKFQLSVHVASAFFPLLIGKGGTTRKRLEGATRTAIGN